MPETQGLNHLGLTVYNLADTTNFFVNQLGWEMQAFDESYPRSTVTGVSTLAIGSFVTFAFIALGGYAGVKYMEWRIMQEV